MLRILEPELMDTPRDAQEYDAMDFTESNTRFAVDALALLSKTKDAEVLDVGTGTARIPILMLDRAPGLKVLAVDLAGEMLRVATRNVVAAGHSERCRMGKLDAKALRLPDRRFDLVMCNSTAHHIPDPRIIFKEMARVLKPNGALIVRDLIRPNTMDEAWATVKRVAAGEHPRQQQLFFDSLCASLTLAEVTDLVAQSGLDRMHVAKVSDRHWTAERAEA
jgi:ubiquinone/menaquinone biosynthesis C-methylase UbiE